MSGEGYSERVSRLEVQVRHLDERWKEIREDLGLIRRTIVGTDEGGGLRERVEAIDKRCIQIHSADKAGWNGLGLGFKAGIVTAVILAGMGGLEIVQKLLASLAG